ncbi:phage terminase small subunit P27 family [Novosphingobium sp. NPDC080210]|uniref:phage terminase small subunit P27 family n=1 Tax=Novosphingobium sp. NPDC080210 TaxID=3390596 RepID=UPI003D089309
MAGFQPRSCVTLFGARRPLFLMAAISLQQSLRTSYQIADFMKPGTKPKPTHLKLVTGNPGKRSLNRKEAKTKAAIPAPPHHLSADAVEEWNRVATELYNLGILSEIDRAALAAYAMAYGRWVQAERAIARMAEKDQLTGGLMIKTSNGNAIQNPLVGTANKAAADMMRYAAEFGMTPSARSRIAAQPPEEGTDPADRFFA